VEVQERAINFQAIVSIASMFGALGLLLGLVIGLTAGHPDAGGLAGAVVGVFFGIRLHKLVRNKLSQPPTPPPGGWKRYNDADEWDS
jgi:hypothetical protein